ncbi:uncharacterized protein [Malus domestica]|uniref:uncharacterized protein n=1 Tax=Malus domestica TaxID=3750 RepID=UPI003975924B
MVTSWESMKRAFLEKFFPTSRVILLRKKISGIQQSQGKSFPAYYERFKALVASCPQHQMKEELLLQYFYEGLLPIERQMLDASVGGLGQKDPPRQQVNEGQQNQAKEISEVKRQIGQISEFMGQFREEGKLPSLTIVNPKGRFETAKAITLRSGKEVGTDSQLSKPAQTEDEKLQQEEDVQNTPTARKETTLPCTPTLPKPSNSTKVRPNSNFSNSIPLNAPFPSRFMQSKNEEDEKDILETFRKVHVNIPLLDAIKQISKYSKFLKKLCTTRKRIREKEVVHVDHLIFPADFYVLDMEDSAHSPSSPLLLGRPFMKTAQTKIDVAK